MKLLFLRTSNKFTETLIQTVTPNQTFKREKFENKRTLTPHYILLSCKSVWKATKVYTTKIYTSHRSVCVACKLRSRSQMEEVNITFKDREVPGITSFASRDNYDGQMCLTEPTRCTFCVSFLTITSICFEQASYSSSGGNLICSVWYISGIHIDQLLSR